MQVWWDRSLGSDGASSNGGVERFTKTYGKDFPGDPVVKSPPANAGDGFDPWSVKSSHAVRQLNPCITTTEPET